MAIPGTRGYGILKYYGPIEGKQGVFAGIELTGPIAASRGKNNGSVDGIQYFDVIQPMSGLFLPIDRLKQANPHLNGMKGSSNTSVYRNRMSSDSLVESPGSGEVFTSPQPTQRSLNRPGSRIGSGTFSPPMYNSQINNPKRSSRTSLNSPPHETRQVSQSYDRLLASLVNGLISENLGGLLNGNGAEWKAKYEACQRELHEKNDILKELQSTLSELQPLLEEYEHDLTEKDNKLARQKAEFERVREDWRQSMDMVVSTHQETEAIYRQKVDELRVQIDQARGAGGDGKVEALLKESALLQEENARLQEQIAQLRQAASDDDRVSVLEQENKLLHNDVSTLHLQIKDRDIRITELEMNSHAVDELLHQLDRTTLDDLHSTIDDLKHQLDVRPTFDELSELQKSLDELDTLHEEELKARDLQISALTKTTDDLNKKLQQLEAAPTTVAEPKKEVVPQPAIGSEDGLPIYKPPAPVDPSAGKNDWCGLCERDGHSSINCPYENDIF